jgi:hypothetical protein
MKTTIMEAFVAIASFLIMTKRFNLAVLFRFNIHNFFVRWFLNNVLTNFHKRLLQYQIGKMGIPCLLLGKKYYCLYSFIRSSVRQSYSLFPRS